jgi:hypothetical protein
MELKPKPAPFILAVLGGMFFIWFSVGIMLSFKEFFWFLGILTVLGGALSLFGVHIFLTRKHRTLTIDPSGITFTNFEQNMHAPADQISQIREIASLRGRGVEISFKSGGASFIDCRHYCQPKAFIKYCQEAGLPCA